MSEIETTEKKSHKKKAAALLLALLGIAGVGSVAMGLWSANANGGGRASSISATTVTVSAATGAADLYPGFTGGDVYFTLTNNNPYPVTFTDMSAGTVTSSDATACPSSNVTVSGATGLSITVPANSTTGTLSVADVASMSSAALDGCQGKSFGVVLQFTGSQS